MTEAFYGDYADIYAQAPYARFATEVASVLPRLWRAHGVVPRSLVDLGCGTGDMLVALAGQLTTMVGVDQSARMLDHARTRATRSGVEITFVQGDLRDFRADPPVDAVTCVFNTLNLVTNVDDLARVFRSARASLGPGGILVFDVHTKAYITRVWADRSFVLQDTDDLFEVWQLPYDPNTGIVCQTLTAFRKSGATWNVIRERHPTCGHDVELVRSLLRSNGFTEVSTYDNLDMDPLTESGQRVWFVAR